MAPDIIETSLGFFDQPVVQYTLTNQNGMRVSIINYGAAVAEIMVPDKLGTLGDVVLGFKSLKGWLQEGNPYFGSIVGRFANRISKGQFSIGDKTFVLAVNNNGNSLHGGIAGFDKKIWEARKVNNNSLNFSYLSEDGEEGYPGNLNISVTYTLTENNELQIDYTATTDKATPVNLTNHSYFNLSAGYDSTIKDHILKINGDRILEVDDELIPTGNFLDVKGTPMDFTTEKLVGQDIGQVKGGGYDHTWVLESRGNSNTCAASVYHPASGRYMQVFTTEPGLQFYSGNFLDGSLVETKNDVDYIKHAAFCLEAQHFPDSPNQPSFPNTILQPGDVYTQLTTYRFGVR